MSLVRIHCWSCARSVEVEQGDPAAGLATRGWALSKGETYCPQCAAARGLVASQPSGQVAQTPASAGIVPAHPETPGAPEEQFPNSPYASGEGRFARSVR